MTSKRNLTWLILTGVLAATACNGSGTGSTPGGDPSGEVPAGPATVKGPVQSFAGGLVVNAVAFRTSGAAIRDDGGPSATLSGGEAELRGRVAEGEVVTVRGSVDDGGRSGQATEIEVHHSVEGELQSAGPGRLVVGGAVVSMDDSTRVTDRNGNPAVSDDLVGQRVEVSG